MKTSVHSGRWILLLVVILWAPASAQEAVRASIQVDLSGSAPDLAPLSTLKDLATGGFTPSHKPTMKMLSLLARDGFQTMRLINVEWDNSAKINEQGRVKIEWSRKLERELDICKQLGFKPHIVIGQVAPHGLQASGKGNERRGVRDWALYRQYLQELFAHVVKERGFTEVIWEVGNEMDNHHFNWLSSEPLDQKLDPNGYGLYLELYRVIAEEVARYRSAHPEVRMLVGGPALTQNSMNHPAGSDHNWLVRFASDVVRYDIVCDFLSMHFYGSAGSRRELTRRVAMMDAASRQGGRSLPLWITEWGASAFFKFENENFAPDAGAFSLEFINAMADSGIERSLFIAVARHTDGKKSGPALLQRDGSASHAYRGIHLIMRLDGERIPCSASAENVSCIASRSDDEIQMVVWHSDWSSRRMGDRSWLQTRRDRTIGLEVSLTGPGGAAWRPTKMIAADDRASGMTPKWEAWSGDRVDLRDNSYLALSLVRIGQVAR